MYTHPSGLTMVGGPKVLILEKESSQELFGSDKAIVGGAGSANDIGSAWGWFTHMEGRPPRIRNAEFVAITKEGIILTTINDLNNWLVLNSEFHAIGSGMQYAIGAMAAGKSPYKAVEIASMFDNATGYDIEEFRV